jgi:hypothetical protein
MTTRRGRFAPLFFLSLAVIVAAAYASPAAAQAPAPAKGPVKTDPFASWIEGFFPWGPGELAIEELSQIKIPGAKLFRATKSHPTEQRFSDQAFLALEDGGKTAIVGDLFLDEARTGRATPIRSDADLEGLRTALKKYLRAPFQWCSIHRRTGPGGRV